MSSPPVVETSSAAASPSNNALDDVFGSEPEPEPDTTTTTALPGQGPNHQPVSSHHPSDMPRLQQEHTTAGYREGVTAAKARSIQAGFDEGFSLGATIGMRAGELLGLLDGIASGLRSSDDDDDDDDDDASARRRAAETLLAEAVAELRTQSIFGPEYWAADGTWKYQVTSATGAAGQRGDGDGDGDGDDIVFADVADSHPLIRKWAARVDEELRRWSIDRTLLLLLQPGESNAKAGAAKSTTPAPAAVATESKPSDVLEW